MAKKKPEPVIEPEIEEEEVTCPVCGKPVGLTVASCPHCGAEFEEGEVEEEILPATEEVAVSEEESAECPVCGKMVSLTVSSCPYCGAEFEEEEVEEIIEVEEQEAAELASVAEAEEPEVEVEEVVEAEEEAVAEERALTEIQAPTTITDMRVIGISMVILGVIGSQIAFMIDWYWTWVPPIESNLGMFVAIPVVIIVVGLLAFTLVKKALGSGRKMPRRMPGMALSLFLFGIFVLVLIMLWDPINSALQDSNVGVGGAFLSVLIVGLLVMFMGQRMTAKSAS